jgi:hypothetical protein
MLQLDRRMLRGFKRAETQINQWSKNALRSPDQSLPHGKRILAKQLDEWFPTQEAFLDLLAQGYELFDVASADFGERALWKFVGNSPKARLLWAKIKTAEGRLPGSPLLLILDPIPFGEAKVRSFSAIHRAKTCVGTTEERAREALHAVGHVVEELYVPYLIQLDKLRALLTGTKVQGSHKPGRLFEKLSPEFVEKGLVSERIVHVRNASAHRHFRHKGRGRLHLWNLWNVKMTWQGEMTTAQLIQLAEEVVDVATAFEKATQVYAFQFNMNLLRPVLPHMVALLRGQLPEEKVAQINREYVLHEKQLLSNLPAARRLLNGA